MAPIASKIEHVTEGGKFSDGLGLLLFASRTAC